MSGKGLYVALFLVSALVSAFSQILLKKSALKTYPSRIREYFNPLVICGYGLLLLCTLLVVFAFRQVPLSLGPLLEASAYVYIMALSALFFKERITPRKIAGNVLIIAGICVFSLFG
jgi:small multidrug resistance pump